MHEILVHDTNFDISQQVFFPTNKKGILACILTRSIYYLCVKPHVMYAFFIVFKFIQDQHEVSIIGDTATNDQPSNSDVKESNDQRNELFEKVDIDEVRIRNITKKL